MLDCLKYKEYLSFFPLVAPGIFVLIVITVNAVREERGRCQQPKPSTKKTTGIMIPTQANSSCREFLQQTIDTDIKLLEDSLRNLKLRRNALQPVSSLPPEIFATIFSYLCLPCIPSLGGKPSRFRISHVCLQWCEIALSQPQLWSHINSNTVTLAGATEILARAKSIPLYMEIKISSQYGRHNELDLFLKEVQAHLPHVRHLSISTERDLELDRTICRELWNYGVTP